MTDFNSYTNLLKGFLPELLEMRRYLHSHPELSGQEYQTAAFVAGELRKYGWQVKEGVGGTGVTAQLGSQNNGLVGLRVDMDALPVEEKTGLPYASLTQGLMHACGHDLHTCIGLGVAKVLAEESIQRKGIRLIFQPAEEIAAGAKWMKADGALKGLSAIFGVHVYPDLKVGQIGVKSGILTAAAGELEIEILGNGGHGARPHETVDSIWIAAKVISGIQEAISRNLDALSPVVISFGKIQGGKAFNVIAERVKLLGTVRCLDMDLTNTLPNWIESVVQSIVSSFGAKASVKYRAIVPPVYNDSYLTDLLESSSIALLGEGNVVRLEKPSLGAEDFAELLEIVPGTMFRLGVQGPSGCSPLHNGSFLPDENSLEVGIMVLVNTLINWLEKQKN